jgi:5-methylcytosine-specific restriction endonuclease McrA
MSKDYHIVSELERLAKEAGVRLEHPNIMANNGHYKIHGQLLVNYYPLSSKKTAYVAGTTKGIQNVSPAQAIKMSQERPKRVAADIKDSRNTNSRKIRQRLLRGRLECICHWCPAIITLDTSTLEHIIPLDRGGLDNDNNRTLACYKCNNDRGNSMPELNKANDHSTNS